MDPQPIDVTDMTELAARTDHLEKMGCISDGTHQAMRTRNDAIDTILERHPPEKWLDISLLNVLNNLAEYNRTLKKATPYRGDATRDTPIVYTDCLPDLEDEIGWLTEGQTKDLAYSVDSNLCVQKPSLPCSKEDKRHVAEVICDRCDELTSNWIGKGTEHVWTGLSYRRGAKVEIVAAKQDDSFVYGKLDNGGVIKLWSRFDQHGDHRGATFVAITSIDVGDNEANLHSTSKELAERIQYLHPKTTSLEYEPTESSGSWEELGKVECFSERCEELRRIYELDPDCLLREHPWTALVPHPLPSIIEYGLASADQVFKEQEPKRRRVTSMSDQPDRNK